LIDSFPCALCHPIRNMRATLLSEVADIGYNATKKIHYYGLKFSVLVSDNGFPIDYSQMKQEQDKSASKKLSQFGKAFLRCFLI
ncbi:TPA: hypothetical protein ACGO5X_002385, partial [Streptococcus suis]